MFTFTTNVSSVTGSSDVTATITLDQLSPTDTTFQLFSNIAGVTFATPTVTMLA